MLALGVVPRPLHRAAVRAAYGIAYGRSPVQRRARELEASQWWPPERLAAMQWQKLQRMVEHAHRHVPYYREAMQKLGIEPGDVREPGDFSRLPVLTKQIINERRAAVVADDADRRTLLRTASGGSTGAPVALYHDQAMIAGYKAAKLRNFRWAGWEPGDAWARLWGSQFDVAPHKQLRQQVWDRLTRVQVLPCWDMSEATMERYARTLQRFQPDVIEAYVTPMYHFARFMKAKSLGGIRPRGIICSAEMLFPHQRTLIEEVFGAKVYNRYGGREMGDVAHECPAGTLHMNMENIYVEFWSEGRAAAPGEAGDLLLTSLDNRAMPLLRYRVEDVGASAGSASCPCGRGLAAMSVVEGRVQDLISLPGGGFLPGEFFPHLFKDFDIRQFQVIQHTLERLEILAVRGPQLQQEQLDYLAGKVREYAGRQLGVSFRFVESIPASGSGKFRYTISHVEPAFRGSPEATHA